MVLIVHNIFISNQMIKSLLAIILLTTLAQGQTITPYYVLPVHSTQNVVTSYSFHFYTDTDITYNAQVSIIFPFEFSPNALTQATRVRHSTNGAQLQNSTWTLNLYTFTIQIAQIAIGNITIVIDGILNPKDYNTSSHFTAQTLFKNVVVTFNQQFGRVPFTLLPVITTGGIVNNFVNRYIEQGSSWNFNFTLSKSYTNATVRFIFPQNFLSNKIQCNVSGVVDPNMKTRVFPSQNVYDCLNLQQPLGGNVAIVLSGVVNPNYQMTASGFQVHIMEPNSVIASEIVTSVSTVSILAKPLNTTLTIPNNYRNNSATYIFQINPDTDLVGGDYMVFTFTGLWNLFTNATSVISGVTSSPTRIPTWRSVVNTTASTTTLTLTNFSSIPKTTQFTFYQPLVTPIASSTYVLTINSYRFNGGLAQTYTQNILINQTTGYIREMKLHPMQRPIKLPVGMTGPLQIVLFLQNNLPQTNVLTYGKIVMEITPNIPAPIVSKNGVPKCYFYKNIPASNCTFDSTDPIKTVVTIFTPVNFNFQQSQVPLTITTQGFQTPSDQGITIDTLVKRYFFKIQFYSNFRPPPIPQEVIFDQWIPDSIPIGSVSCTNTVLNEYQYQHLKCTFTTPTQVLNSNGYIHFFRVEFSQSTGWGWYPGSSTITADYPCLMYGVNVSANPYVRCDYVTWTGGPYKSSQSTTSYNYITFYGLSTIPGGSTITFEIPYIRRYYNGWDTSIKFSILEDTPGYSSPIVYLYTQTISTGTNYGNIGGYNYEIPSYTLSNSVINKVTSITLNSYNLATSGVTQIIFEVDQTAFPNIGRGNNIACGSHLCSKFDLPIQYFILYPSSALGSSATLTFPAITNPPYAGTFTFYTRVYKSSSTQKKNYFYITINPDTIVDCSYKFSPLQTVSTLYPNSDRFYVVSWTTVNPIIGQGANAYILITINNIFTFSSTYCQLSTTASGLDGRGIICEIYSGGTQVYLKNLNNMPAGTTFNLTLQMRSTSTASTVSPTVNIQTYYGSGKPVDQVLNLPFITTPLTNSLMSVMTSFVVPPAFTSVRAVTAGYYGHLLLTFQPQSSGSVVNGSKIIVTMSNGFYPAGNALGLPLSCILNGIRQVCTYSLSPFTITLTGTNNLFTTASNTINITTLYQNSNGIYYPSSPGRYLLQMQILNSSTSQTLEKVQQYIDIIPGDVSYFNVTSAHRDRNQPSIYTVQFKNGPTAIPSYNDATTAGRIYIGFPTVNDASVSVFTSNLGFASTQGLLLPCYFDTGVNFVTATSGKSLACKLKVSSLTGYPVWIEIVNFALIAPNAIFRVFIGKVLNPANQQIDINFILKINSIAVSTKIQTQLYLTTYNYFLDMLPASITNRNQANSNTVFFQPGSTIGQTNRYFNITPYSAGTFVTHDWFIVLMDTQFPLSGAINNCQSPFYQYCIIYPTINWLAIKIGNGTIISLQPFISKLPISISRVDTTFTCYTFMAARFNEQITYTMTAAYRWLELRGTISGFTIDVVGSQNKLNVNQKNVQIIISFNVSHMVPIGGTIEIQFPNNATAVPAIKPHCRSAVTMGSTLYGYNTGKPSVNVQGEIGCTVQNTYSWIITGFDTLAAGSQVKIFGFIDFPTVPLNSLGMGYVCTYSNQHATNAFVNAKTISYLSTNFPFPVQNLTWNVDPTMTMLKTQPLRINYVGQFNFVLNLAATLYSRGYGAYILLSFSYYSITGAAGGFNGPSSNLVCTIFDPATNYKYGCYVTLYATPGSYTAYKIISYQNLPANTNLDITLTTQKGSQPEGINYPTVIGTYKITAQIYYGSPNTNYRISTGTYVDVYGSNFNTLFFNSTITMPGDNNFIMVIFTPSSTINTNQQFIIEIPTIAADGSSQFPVDLGMGYEDYDELIFDIFQSGISSMNCKVYTGDTTAYQPVKIVCSNFNTAITTSMTVKFGFWVVNPTSSISMAIPVQVYAFDQPSQTKFCWSIIQAGIRIIPTVVTPTNDIGNWVSSTAFRGIYSTSLSFTTRNTKPMVSLDWYILKFNFDLRNSGTNLNAFAYNSNMAGTGDAIIMRNCRTILFRVGTTVLSIPTPGSTTVTGRINSLFHNPLTQLSTSQALILGYVVYNSADACEKVIYKDSIPAHPPYEPSDQSFSMTSIYGNNQRSQNDDYRFSFTMSTSMTTTVMPIKLISIQFPNITTYDLKIQGQSCLEYSSSAIEVDTCIIDSVNRVIWITPVIKTYYYSNNIIIETAGLAIQSPTVTSINLNSFIIKYYTWPDGQSQPAISKDSDNWCFARQDSSGLASQSFTFSSITATYYTPHTSVSVAKQVIVNEWEPASYYIGDVNYANLAKSPFIFKFIAPVAFSSLSGGNYHTISLTYSSYYSNPTLNQYTNDLEKYRPTCSLNGNRIHACSISSGSITMSFQNALANGKEVTVKFSIVNPYNENDEGFTLTTTSDGTITLPIYITPSGGTTYYVQPQPFHPYYYIGSGATYPSMGISDVDIYWGTQANGQLNYLQFVITLTRNDINGLVLQIPVVSEDGIVIYNNPLLLNLPSGSKYPCSMGVYTNVYCYYIAGSSTNYGTPTRIYIADFSVPANNSISFRMLFTNPDIVGVFPKFTFKAYGGSYSAPNTMGDQLRGFYTLVDPFKTYSSANYYSTETATCYPNKGLWRPQTVYDCYISQQNQAANTYAILRWPLVDSTYGTIGQYDSSYGHYDHFFMSVQGTNQLNVMYAYIVIKLGSTFVASGSSYYRFGYIRMKHHIVNSYPLYLLAKDWTKLYTVSVDNSWVKTNRCVNHMGQFSVSVIDAKQRTCNEWTWHFITIGTGSASSIGFNGNEPSSLVMEIVFASGKPFTAFSSSNYQNRCQIDTGIIGYDPLNPVTCVMDVTNQKFIISNFYLFTNTPLRIFYYAKTACSQSGLDVTVTVFANQQAFSEYNWPLFYSTTGNGWSFNTMWYSGYDYYGRYNYNGFVSVQPPYSVMTPASDSYSTFTNIFNGADIDGGYVQITSASTTSVTFKMLLTRQLDFYYHTYRMGFRFYATRLQASGQSCNSVSVYSSRYGSSPIGSYSACGTGDRMFFVVWYMYSNSYYQYEWRNWYVNDYYEFTFNFNSIGQDTNIYANQIYLHASLVWENAIYYSGDEGKCGCCQRCCAAAYYVCNPGCTSHTCCTSYTCGFWGDDCCSYSACCSSNCAYYTCDNNYCCAGCSCRYQWGWGYVVLTNANAGGWSQPVNSISQSQSIDLVSNEFGMQTQFSFYLQNLYAGFTSTMTSGTAGSSAQLLISFTGNNVFSSSNPFKYTDSSESAAYIECLCVVSSSSISISAGTTYTAANCTRYIIANYPPFLTVRIDANAGQYLACYFPGFNNPTTSSNGWTMYANFYRDVQNHFKYWSLPNQFRSTYQTTGVSKGLSNPSYSNFNTLSYQGEFWQKSGQVLQTKFYRLYAVAPGSKYRPIFYHSGLSPQFQQSTTCVAPGVYLICRAYNSFLTRRYYIVAQYNDWTNFIMLSGNLRFPQSKDASTSYYGTFFAFTNGGFGDYYSAQSSSLDSSCLSPATPTFGLIPSLHSTDLRYTKSLMSVSIDLAGFTLYSNQRTQGPFYNSFAVLTLSGFSSLNGCGVYISNVPTPAWKNNAIYCIIQSNTQIRIYSNADWVFSGTMYITFQTDSLPASSTYTFTLYDKYYSGSNYARSVYTQASFGRSVSGSYSTLQPTSVKWRRQAYKQTRTDAGPIRITLNNNYQYVSIYDSSSNAEDATQSSGIQVYVPGSGLSNNAYYCYLREYLQNEYSTYKEYVVNCQYSTTTQVLIKSIPSHILNPMYFYELIIYKNTGSGSSLISIPSSSSYIMQVKTIDAYSGGSILYFSTIPILKYQTVYPITLNSIYILTREAAAINSLYIDFTMNFALSSSNIYFLEFVFDILDLNYFNIGNGERIPCSLGNNFGNYPSKLNPPRCYGYTNGAGKTTPLIIRVFKFAGFSSGTVYQISFDNFNNPPLNSLRLLPINLELNLVDRTNTKLYTSFFPDIYISDSVNVVVPSSLGGSVSMATSQRGSSTNHYVGISWPYNSNYNYISQKTVMKIYKGITCCQTFSSLSLNDSQSSGYTLLWTNPFLNISVYRTPSKSVSTSTSWHILSVVNPNQVSEQTYDKVPTVTFMMYDSYQTKYVTTIAQPAFSSYSKVTDFTVTGSPSPVQTSTNYEWHADLPVTYEFSWDFASNSYANKNISYIIMYFTSGVSRVDYAWFRYAPSPYFTNPNGNVKVGYNSGNSQWFINITGIKDSTFSSSNYWYVRVRLYINGNGNYFYYTSYAYNYNGGLQYTSTSGNRYLPSDSWTSSGYYNPPNAWNIQFQRYTRGYYELASKVLYAAASQTTNKLFFKFTTPYNLSETDSINFISSTPTFLAPNTPNNKLYCIYQKTSYIKSKYGTGLYAPCTFISGSTGTYSVGIPSGGMTTGEYLLTIIDRAQLTSTFNMPTTPQRVQVSLIYNNAQNNLQYGDVYTLDFAGQMTAYDVSHSTLITGAMNMLGFTFTPAFTLPVSSTSSPITQSILSFELQSNYYDSCLSISANVFGPESMTFYNGIYYSHFSNPAFNNANTRVLCGQNTQNQNWAPIKLTVTDYSALTAGTSYYFRFPLITLPSPNYSPLTYKVKLLQYANGKAFPTVISQYTYENLYSVTTSYNSYTQVAYVNLGTAVVQNTMSVSFNYHSSWFNIYWSGYQTLVKFANDAISSITSLNALTTLTNSGYNYQYYPNINLCSFIKNSNGNNYGFSLGSFPTAVDEQPFEINYVFTYVGQSEVHYARFSSQVAYSSAISKVSTWTSSSFTRGTNLASSNSQDLYTITWSANYLTFPEGGFMTVILPNYYTMTDQFCYSYSGFIQGTNPDSNLVCKRMNANTVNIYGYASLSVSATLSISVYLRINNIAANTYVDSAEIIVYTSSSLRTVIDANTNTYSLTVSQIGSLNLDLTGTMVRPYTSDTAFPLYITFQLNSYSLVNGDWLQIDFGNWVLDTAPTGVQVFKYKIAGNIYWVPSQATLVSGNIYKVPVYSNYSMPAGNQITLWVDTFVPASWYGTKVSATKWNTFSIYAYKSSAVVEQRITRIWTEPYGHPSFVATPALNYVGETTLWQFSVTPNISASAGDSILIEFQTCDQLNGLQTQLFSNTLGASIPAGNPGSFDCNQYYQTNIISSSPIKCRVYAGDNTQNPPIPTTIAIPIDLAIPANTLIRFNILNIVNPTMANYPMSVVFKLATPCSSNDRNNLCAFYKSVTYLSFNNNPGVPGLGSTGSLSFSPSIVSANNTQHTISASYALQSGDFLKLTYYPQIPIPTICSFTSNKGQCYSYPTNNIIIIKINQTVTSPYSLVLGGMSNPYQNYYGTNTFRTQIWRSGSVYVKFYSSYQATTITTDPTSGNPLTISFVPTLTPNYQLKYGFWNIARITITNMIQNSKVKQIRINSPGQIVIDTQYCNATVQTYAGEAIPYPYRLVCQSMGSNYVTLNMFNNFPTWDNGFTQRSIYIYLRYTISNGQTVASNNWNAYAYTDTSSTSWYYAVSYAVGNFPIVEYQLPFLYVINFPTRSFNQRTCTIGQKCMIYGFIYPTTPSTTIGINRMSFLLPKEFNYSNVQTYDSCFIQSRTTTYYTFSCPISRNSSQITIGFTPPGYDQKYNLFNIDHSSASMLFTAPNFPGNHYQMQVNLWSTSNTLVESQYINLTTVYGYYLSVPLITFLIPLDASARGLYDLTFTTGTADILPSYINSAAYTVTSAIQISFANSFDASLGTSLAAGSQIACLPISGLTFNIMGKLTCKIYPSVSTITYPTIIVTGYDRIYAGTVVRIQFANLKTLAAGITDYCTLGVSYTYFNYGGVKGFIYEPVSFVVGPTSAAITPTTITYTISQISTNFVGELSNYTIAGTLGGGFSPITTSDYFVVQFPPYIVQGRFNLNANALCSLAASNKCYVFGLANQVYIQPSASVTSAAFSFTIQNILNAAYELSYIQQNVTLFTVVGRKVNALGYATFLKFTQASKNVTAKIISVDSIYGGDSGINYYFSFQLNSYLPEYGKISIIFSSVFYSLFSVNAKCSINTASRLLMGNQASCEIIDNYQIIVAPNGVLLSTSQPYYITVTNITNPNSDLSGQTFKIETYYTSDVYNARVISRSTFTSPTLSIITVKTCELQVSASIYNQNMQAKYQINLICGATIKSSSELKVYLSWNPTPTNLTCNSDANVLYSSQCRITTEFSKTTKLTYLSIFLRSIQAQKLISINVLIPNGPQGTYSMTSSINYNGFVYLQAISNSFYITAQGNSSSTAVTVRSRNYPLNRYQSSIYAFAMTNPKVVVSTLEIVLPSTIVQSTSGISCGYQSYNADDDYFNLMMRDGTNQLTCDMIGQTISIKDITTILGNLTDSGFLYLTINGLVNPATSISRSNFNFTLISTTSTIKKALAIYTIPLSYSVSDPPANMQIANIALSDSKFFVSSLHSFTITTALTIIKNTNMGIIIRFPQEYAGIWQQIAVPSVLNLTINSVIYQATNITMKSQYLFARLPTNSFSSQLSVTSLTISFNFRNPNKSIDCTVTPVYLITFFNFQTNSIFGQTLSNNQVCPTLTNRLFSINVTGNTKIPAGTSSNFIVTIEKPAYYLAITPKCTSSAISFIPSVITFQNFTSTTANFSISAAVGLTGNYNVTFTKVQTSQAFYNDIQFTTLNIYAPTTSYKIRITTFSTKSVGYPIPAKWTLDTPSPTDFSLTYSHNCNSDFNITPTGRISIPAQTTQVYFYVQYNGKKVPTACSLNFSVSSLTNNNFELESTILYLSGKISFDKSSNTRPLILQLTKTPKDSQDVGAIVVSANATGSSSSEKYYASNTPTLSKLVVSSTRSNSADFTATTSMSGKVYFAILLSGTPTSKISQAQIYNKSLSNSVFFGNAQSASQNEGVNIISTLSATGLSVQTNYIIGAYLNSTVGNSPIVYLNFSTANSTNGASIKLAMSSIVNDTQLISALSSVWRIKQSRIGILTKQEKLTDLQTTFTSSVMNSRNYIYEIVVAPDTDDDSTKPLDLLNSFVQTNSSITMLLGLVPQYITTYNSQIREIIPAKPKARANIIVQTASHQKITVSIKFWEQAYVYGVAIKNSKKKPLSSQIAKGLDSDNNKLVDQQFVFTTTNSEGVANLTFTLLDDNSTYTVYITAECVLPFTPRIRLSDAEVLSVVIATKLNLNLKKNEDQAKEYLKSFNPKLAEQVKIHMNKVSAAKKVQGQSNRRDRS